MPNEIGTTRTVIVLAVIAVCFAVLWPKFFYPMLTMGEDLNGQLRQERPVHLRPELMHPILRDKSRIHQAPTNRGSKLSSSVRPPLGSSGSSGSGKNSGSSGSSIFMNFIMPIYTMAIVLFFLYAMMRICTKRGPAEQPEEESSDDEFSQCVYGDERSNGGTSRQDMPHCSKSIPKNDDCTRLSWRERYIILSAITGLLKEVDKRLECERARATQSQYSTELKQSIEYEETCMDEAKGMEIVVLKPENKVHINNTVAYCIDNGNDFQANDTSETVSKIKVLGLEVMAECEGGGKWDRPVTPTLGVGGCNRPNTPKPFQEQSEPQNIYLEGALPTQSQLLVTDSKTQAVTVASESKPEPSVVLSSKMTLSLISLDGEEERPLEASFQNLDVQSSDNFNSADSTLRDVDSELIDDMEQIEQGTYEEFQDAYERNNEMEMQERKKIEEEASGSLVKKNEKEFVLVIKSVKDEEKLKAMKGEVSNAEENEYESKLTLLDYEDDAEFKENAKEEKTRMKAKRNKKQKEHKEMNATINDSNLQKTNDMPTGDQDDIQQAEIRLYYNSSSEESGTETLLGEDEFGDCVYEIPEN